MRAVKAGAAAGESISSMLMGDLEDISVDDAAMAGADLSIFRAQRFLDLRCIHQSGLIVGAGGYHSIFSTFAGFIVVLSSLKLLLVSSAFIVLLEAAAAVLFTARWIF